MDLKADLCVQPRRYTLGKYQEHWPVRTANPKTPSTQLANRLLRCERENVSCRSGPITQLSIHLYDVYSGRVNNLPSSERTVGNGTELLPGTERGTEESFDIRFFFGICRNDDVPPSLEMIHRVGNMQSRPHKEPGNGIDWGRLHEVRSSPVSVQFHYVEYTPGRG